MSDRPLAPPASEIRDLFDRIAPGLRPAEQLVKSWSDRVWKLMAVKWSNPNPGNIGLDLCCGSGDLAQKLARQIGVAVHFMGWIFHRLY
jgi:demethylmenaquinone methyltransferase/2-methoxy-6-polyprenyl-1,4-benzoquinol methylase